MSIAPSSSLIEELSRAAVVDDVLLESAMILLRRSEICPKDRSACMPNLFQMYKNLETSFYMPFFDFGT
jgi:hypothetical protein